jgi:hypothetical protein
MPTYQLERIIPMITGAIDDALRFYLAQLIIYFYTGVLWFIIGFKTDPLKAFLVL